MLGGTRAAARARAHIRPGRGGVIARMLRRQTHARPTVRRGENQWKWQNRGCAETTTQVRIPDARAPSCEFVNREPF
jgi:hypothetical protein